MLASLFACQWVIECSNDHSPDTGILTAASFHRHTDWHAISYGELQVKKKNTKEPLAVTMKRLQERG